jgi:hypothetical protein
MVEPFLHACHSALGRMISRMISCRFASFCHWQEIASVIVEEHVRCAKVDRLGKPRPGAATL